jgi:hypothetical protein
VMMRSIVGSLARLRNRTVRSSEPFSSKSCKQMRHMSNLGLGKTQLACKWPEGSGPLLLAIRQLPKIYGSLSPSSSRCSGDPSKPVRHPPLKHFLRLPQPLPTSISASH